MSWTAAVTGKRRDQFNIVATITYTSDKGDPPIVRDIPGADLTDAGLAKFVNAQLDILNAGDDCLAALSLAPVGKPPAPTQAQIDADAFFVMLATLNDLQSQVDKGIIQADDPSITQAAADMKSAFLPEYTADSRWR